MRALVSALFVVFIGSASAHWEPRVPIENTGATVEHPQGWMLLPASGSPPVVMFNLCDPEMTDGCLVRGEISMSGPNVAQEEASIDTRLADANAGPQTGPAGHRALKSGHYDAVESFWQGPHSNHISTVVKRGFMQISTPSGWYDCMLTTTPDRFEGQIEQWRRFCASLETAQITTDAPSDG